MFNFKKAFILPAAAAFLVCPSLALAQNSANNCNDFDSNSEWQNLMSQFLMQYQNKSQPRPALETALKLNEICDSVPSLNYYIHILYPRIDKPDKAEYHLRRAIQNPGGFGIDASDLENYYYDLYTLTHPGALTKEEVDKLVDAKDKNCTERIKEAVAITPSDDKAHAISKTVMWTGAGIGIAGIAVTVVGGVLLATYPKKELDFTNSGQVSNGDEWNDNNQMRINAYATITGGVVATAIGAIMAGIGGYYYTRTKPNEMAITDDVTLNWDLGVNSWQVGLTF